jgi:regulator of replication initiation timing
MSLDGPVAGARWWQNVAGEDEERRAVAQELTARKGKTVGTRDRVVTWLAASGAVDDPSGMASASLARSIGYPGSSIAFAQLLSGMERSGLITRDVRGKRTYRVELTEAGRERAAGSPGVPRRTPMLGRSTEVVPSRGASTGVRAAEVDELVDYDELARRLLRQVARRLVGTDEGEREAVAGDRERAGGGAVDTLEQRVSALESELSAARAARMALEEKNEQLRVDLERIRSALDVEGVRSQPVRTLASPPAEEIDHREIALLRQLLSEHEARREGRRDTGRPGRAALP